MKKIFALSLFSGVCSIIIGTNSFAATPWWQQPTICRPNPTSCYASMGMGFDTEMWDATGNCRGLKLVCPNATTANDTDPVAMGKLTIAAGTGINPDFDTNVLANDCFGARKTTANGSMASVNGSFVKVWCNGVLPSPDETLSSGEIKFGTQPKCTDLSSDGWVAVLNSTCYGKYFDQSDYYIECEGNTETPKRIVQLNGATGITGTGSAPTTYPTSVAAARDIFDAMQATSAAQRAEHFQ